MGHWGGKSGNFDRGAGDRDSVLQHRAGQPHDKGILDCGKLYIVISQDEYVQTSIYTPYINIIMACNW